MGLFDVRCALCGISSIGRRLALIWIHEGRIVGPVVFGDSDRGGAIDGMAVRPHHDAQVAELAAWEAEGRLDRSRADPAERIRRHRRGAHALEVETVRIASAQHGGGWPLLLDGEPLGFVPVLEEVARAAADIEEAAAVEPLMSATDPQELRVAAGVLHVYRALGGQLPPSPELEQLHIDMVDHIEAQRRDALVRLERWPELVYPLED